MSGSKQKKDSIEIFIEKLYEYKIKYNTLVISPDVPEYLYFKRKTDICRAYFSKNKLNENTIIKLSEIGFDFNPYQTIWLNWYNQLKEYKSIYNNCNVPYRCKGYYELSIWVYNQRRYYKLGKLSRFRCDLLRQIGVSWLI